MKPSLALCVAAGLVLLTASVVGAQTVKPGLSSTSGHAAAIIQPPGTAASTPSMPTIASARASDLVTPAQADPNSAGSKRFGLTQYQTADVIRIALVLTLLTLLPAMAVCMTPFIRITVVLSIIRHAFGMPETPPSQVLISLALLLTAFVMGPAIERINSDALQPFLNNTISVETAIQKGSDPLRTFMLRQVHDQDIKTVYDMAKRPLPPRASQVGLMELTTAYMLNELRVSFKIGFVLFLPFVLIDLVVASILLALGMMMVPPTTLSLPIKILMFVLIDGWSLVLQGVAGSFR